MNSQNATKYVNIKICLIKLNEDQHKMINNLSAQILILTLFGLFTRGLGIRQYITLESDDIISYKNFTSFLCSHYYKKKIHPYKICLVPELPFYDIYGFMPNRCVSSTWFDIPFLVSVIKVFLHSKCAFVPFLTSSPVF